MERRLDLYDRYDNLPEFPIFRITWWPLGLPVIFLMSVFSPFCPSAICVLSAVQPIVSVWISRTSWRNWTGTESTLKMSAEEFACFPSVLDNGNDCNISPPALDVQEIDSGTTG